MYFLIYSSYAVASFTEDELKLMLVQAREKNKEHGVTGMLLYFDGKFLQLIEGENHAIEQLYQNIENDERHTNVMVLEEGEIDVRYFEDWSMGYKSVRSNELANEEGFKNLNPPNTLNKHSALKLFKILSASK